MNRSSKIHRRKWRAYMLPILMAIATPWQAMSQDSATFAMSGTLVGTCRVTTEDVGLEYALADFTGIGNDQPWKSFNITSAGCDDGVGGALRITITGAIDPVDSTLFEVTGVSGVGLEIQTADARPVNPDGSGAPTWTPGDVGYLYSYRARFAQRSRDVTPGVGRVTAVINLTLN